MLWTSVMFMVGIIFLESQYALRWLIIYPHYVNKNFFFLTSLRDANKNIKQINPQYVSQIMIIISYIQR